MIVRARSLVAVVLVVVLAWSALSFGHSPTRAAGTPGALATPITSPVASPSASPLASPAASPVALTQPMSWVELGPDAVQIARAITSSSTCPDITIDGAAQAMTVRAPADAAFPVTVCETQLPAGTHAASIAGHTLHVLTATPRNIAVIGDTGCRIKGSAIQDCLNPAKWPFPAIARDVAAGQPDLVIHVGDYHYRESACPESDAAECDQSPTGDTWASWNADFFQPAAPLLASAPWVFVRGNHEDCSRAGAGWFRFLDPRPLPSTCQDYTDPYAVPLGNQTLVVFDSAAAGDGTADPSQVAKYQKQLAQVAQLAGDNAWLLSHRPIWGPVELNGGKTLATGNLTLQVASANKVPPGIKLMLSGHIHLAEALGFAPSAHRPPVFIAGNGGTEMDPPIKRSLIGVNIGGQPLAVAETYQAFGYLTLAASNNGWVGTEHTVDGKVLTTCTVGTYSLSCAA